jgi:peroxiredoxin
MLLARRMLLPACLLIFMSGCALFRGNPVASLLKGRQAAVIVFLAPDCPLSQTYAGTLNELRAKFQGRGIEFFGVFAGRGAESAQDFARTYGMQLPALPDADFRMADFLKAGTTPEAFVLDGDGRIVYSGAIDNRAPELGQRRTVITERYVLDALQSIVDKRKVRIERAPPVGCYIERPRNS